MKIEILKSAKEALGRSFKGKNVVVIDVLRATTVMVTALENGAKCIYPFKEIEDARDKCKLSQNGLLAGERKGMKILGFDFGNSPLEFTKEKVEGKEIYMTTSNGTRAIENSIDGDNLYIACYLNISAVVNKLLLDTKDIIILCSGTDDKFSLDDSLCAGIITQKISDKLKVEMDDFVLSLEKLARYSSGITKVLEGSKHYDYLKKIGYKDDLEYCTKIDICNVVPFYIEGKIKTSS